MTSGSIRQPPDSHVEPAHRSFLMRVWEGITRAGLAEAAFRLGTHAFLLAVILLVAWGLQRFYLRAQQKDTPRQALFVDTLPQITPTDLPPALPPFKLVIEGKLLGIARQAHLHTDVPSRPRMEVIKYTVQAGDTLFGIADKFGLRPETILWANQSVLGDNPHNLRPGQELIILPVDGTYHRWSAGDSLTGVAEFFGVAPEAIVNFPGNHLAPDMINHLSDPDIEPGTWLVIPGGRREFVSWSAPNIPRDNPGVAQILGPGACDSVADGAIGIGAFIWPVITHQTSGFAYDPSVNHLGIDIVGDENDPVYAADHGVIVYAGWNDWGYGNMIVINHGNGWQTLYAHLHTFYVSCGQSVFQGNVIGTVGSTGNATGPHLHFEVMFNGVKVNPLDYLP